MIVIALILIALSGVFEAIRDILDHKYYDSVFRDQNIQFWHPDYSWKNKWKGGDKRNGEKFFGSSTAFVFLTDAWHLFKTLESTSLWIGSIMLGYSVTGHGLTSFLSLCLVAVALNRVVFELFYSYILVRNRL